MATEDLIEVTVFCTYHQVEYAFITSLEEAGLVHFTFVNQERFIPQNQLSQLEKMIRLHQELDINIAGIEAIANVLDRLEDLQRQNLNLRNKLRLYEAL
jgi:chaperone modulatory protein CbpM